jgi:hypothetical protein
VNTVAIVLRVGKDRTEEFERGFRKHELPVWEDLHGRGTLVRASLSKLDIASPQVDGAQQYLVVAVFKDPEGHHEHDSHPGFRDWDRRAEDFQVAEPLAFGGDTILHVEG